MRVCACVSQHYCIYLTRVIFWYTRILVGRHTLQLFACTNMSHRYFVTRALSPPPPQKYIHRQKQTRSKSFRGGVKRSKGRYVEVFAVMDSLRLTQTEVLTQSVAVKLMTCWLAASLTQLEMVSATAFYDQLGARGAVKGKDKEGRREEDERRH